MQIYSHAVGVCCKASALEASAFATNTCVSAINLHQCSAADLNPYIINLNNLIKSSIFKYIFYQLGQTQEMTFVSRGVKVFHEVTQAFVNEALLTKAIASRIILRICLINKHYKMAK